MAVFTSAQDFFVLRALDSNFREIAVKSENSNFFIFSQKKPFGELFTKITIKLSKEFSFLRNSAKCEMPCSRHSRH